jgi:thioredoxin 1
MVGFLTKSAGGRKPMAEEKHLELSDADFDQKLSSIKETVLVDFWAPWCGPCRMLAPIIDDLATEYAGKLTVAKVNTDENQKVSAKYGIMSIPTLIIFKGGKAVDRVIGYMSKKDLKARLDKSLA